MGGSGGGFFGRKTDPKTLSDKLRQTEAKTIDEKWETQVNDLISSLLPKINRWDDETIRKHLENLRTALGKEIEGTWNVRFRSELHMTNDSHLFKTAPTDYPLYEGKMIWHFDSEFETPRYWLDKEEVETALGENAWEGKHYRVGFRDIAASTNERTLVVTLVPPNWIGNTLPTVISRNIDSFSDGPDETKACTA